MDKKPVTRGCCSMVLLLYGFTAHSMASSNTKRYFFTYNTGSRVVIKASFYTNPSRLSNFQDKNDAAEPRQ